MAAKTKRAGDPKERLETRLKKAKARLKKVAAQPATPATRLAGKRVKAYDSTPRDVAGRVLYSVALRPDR